MTTTPLRIPPGIFDDPTFGLADRFDSEMIPVSDFHAWWADVTDLRLDEARAAAVGHFHAARTRDGQRWCYRRSAVQRRLIDRHGRRLHLWLAASLEWSAELGLGLPSLGGDYPYYDEERFTVLAGHASVAAACVRRALDLDCSLADQLLAILQEESPWDATKLGHEWGWTTGLPPETEDDLVEIAAAVRWWSITADIGVTDAQTALAEKLRVADRDGQPAFVRSELLAATCGRRLSTLRQRVSGAMDHMINEECTYSELLAAPDVLLNNLREAFRLDAAKGEELLEWTRGYFPHIAEEIDKERS